MFKKNLDGSYEFSRRFWVSVGVMLFGFAAIFLNTYRINQRTEQVYDDTVAYAQQTNECLNQLITINRARAALNAERDDISESQRLDILNMFRELLGAPPEINKLSPADPVRQKWGEDVVRKYVISIGRAQMRVEQIKTELTAHPVPEPNCGFKLPGE